MIISINGNDCNTINDIKKFAPIEVSDFIEEFLDDNEFVVAHTSGSTGTPKEIKLNKSDMKCSANLTNDFFNLTKDSVFYLNLSPSYIAGKMMIVRALELNAKLITEIPSNEPLSSYKDETQRISLGAFVPSQLGYLINHPDKLKLIDNMIIGGGALSERIERWLAENGINAYRTYGMTETCSHVSLAKVGTCTQPFKALGNISFDIDDRNCLIINHPDFSTKQFITNDVVELLSKTVFNWLGRYDNVINTGGIKVFPEMIEPLIAKVIRKAKFYLTSIQSEKWGEELAIAIEYSSLKDGEIKTGPIAQNTVEQLKQLLPKYSIPKLYIAVNKFKYTSSGKIIRTKYL